MDLNFTQEENAFRDEVRKFFRENIPPALHKKLIDGGHPSKEDIITWTRILNKKGWGVPHWPKEYGGTGWSPAKQHIFLKSCRQRPRRRRSHSASTWSAR